MTRQDRTVSIDEIDELLPQTQCTQCGYSGCRPYAQAIAAGSAHINQCPPGGDDVIEDLAALMGIPFEPLNPRFGVTKQPAVAVIEEQTCIGCTLCIQACPVDAIIGAAKVMHTVVENDCTGCELCIPACPVDCIGMREPSRSFGRQERRARAVAARRRFEFRNLRLQLEKSGPVSKGDAPIRNGFADTKRATIEKAIARARLRLRQSER